MDTIHALFQLAAVKGAIIGGGTALLVDLHAWSSADDPFNWQKSLKRVVGGATTGAAGAWGMSL
jgi:hypothetical protein